MLESTAHVPQCSFENNYISHVYLVKSFRVSQSILKGTVGTVCIIVIEYVVNGIKLSCLKYWTSGSDTCCRDCLKMQECGDRV